MITPILHVFLTELMYQQEIRFNKDKIQFRKVNALSVTDNRDLYLTDY